MLAPLAGAVIFEIVRAYARAFEFTADVWQMALGAFMLVIVLFMPGGLWTLWERAAAATRRAVRAGRRKAEARGKVGGTR